MRDYEGRSEKIGDYEGRSENIWDYEGRSEKISGGSVELPRLPVTGLVIGLNFMTDSHPI